MVTLPSLETISQVMGIADASVTLGGVAIAGVAYWAIRREHRRNVYRNKVSCTLNFIEDRDDGPWLVLGSLYGGQVSNIFGEDPTLKAYQKGVERTSQSCPFVTVSDDTARRAVLGDLTRYFIEHVETGSLKEYLNVTSLKGIKFVGVPTFEHFRKGGVRAHMNRPWYIPENHLERFLEDDFRPKAKSDHGDRVPWWKIVAKIYNNKEVGEFSESQENAIRAMIDVIQY